MQYVVNGAVVPASEATLQVGDLAILRGYGIFDFFLFEEFRPLFFDQYLDRFYRSAERMHMEVPYDRKELTRQILDLIAANGKKRGGIRLVLTGGYTEDGYAPSRPNVVIMQYPMPGHPESCYTEGVKLLTHPYRREVPDVKTINYLMGIQMLPKLRASGAKELLYHAGPHITESTRSNFFMVTADDTLVTPSEDILYGITRHQVLDIAASDMKVEVRDVTLDELADIKEAFLTGSTKKVMPVVGINSLVVGTGRPGPVTQRIMQAYADRCEAYLQEKWRGQKSEIRG